MANGLTKAGLEVVSLEQGPWLTTEEDFSHDHDEPRYNQRREMMVDLSRETWTWRPAPKERALPMRQYGSFVKVILPNKGVILHNFSIDELGIDVDIDPGATEETTINAPAGEYRYY